MKSCFAVGLVLLLLGAVPGEAQLPSPHPQLSKLNAMLGDWDGSGKRWERAGAEPVSWTARRTVSRILAGHYIQEDMRIEMSGRGPGPLVYRTIYTWDANAGCFMSLEMSNLGTVHYGPVYWTSKDRLVSTRNRTYPDFHMTEQRVDEFTPDSVITRIWASVDGGEFFLVGEGEFAPGQTLYSAEKEAGDIALGPLAPEMKELEGQIGSWTLEMGYASRPGGPLNRGTSKREIAEFLGGHVQLSTGQSDPIPGLDRVQRFRSQSYLAWDAQANCLRRVDLSNYGSLRVAKAYLMGRNRLISIDAGISSGLAQSSRTVTTWNDDWTEVEFATDRCSGDYPPDRAFEGLMKRIGD